MNVEGLSPLQLAILNSLAESGEVRRSGIDEFFVDLVDPPSPTAVVQSLNGLRRRGLVATTKKDGIAAAAGSSVVSKPGRQVVTYSLAHPADEIFAAILRHVIATVFNGSVDRMRKQLERL